MDFRQESGMIKLALEQSHSYKRGAVQAFGKSLRKLSVIQVRGKDGLNFGLAVNIEGERCERYYD